MPLADRIWHDARKDLALRRGSSSRPMVDYLSDMLEDAGNDASWIRKTYRKAGSFPALMAVQAEKWRENDPMLPRW